MSFAGVDSDCSDREQLQTESEDRGLHNHYSTNELQEQEHEQQEVETSRVAVVENVNEQSERMHDPSPLTKSVVLYENERYQVTAFGWSKNGLLPTDRKHISTRNGKHGWPTLEAADMEMITHGWTWLESKWAVEQGPSGSNLSSDGEGWTYATNFGSIEESGSAMKGMTHFVRRRRLTRQQIFMGPSLIKGTCDHCDSAEVQRLSDCLLEALTQTSLHENPGEYSEVITNRLKNMLHELLGLASRDQHFTDMAGVNQCIDKFFISVINAKSAWAKLSSIVGADYLPEKLPERAVEVSSFSFSLEERREVARMLIRKYDTSFVHHCDKVNCGAACSFALVSCSNLGCSEVLSTKYTSSHLEECHFTRIACERGCGEIVVRKEMSCHLTLTCDLRPVECPYACIGCRPDDLTARTLARHLSDPVQTNAHLLLSLNRLNEQQGVIVSLHKKVNSLEGSVGAHDRAIKQLQGGAVATAVAIKTSEQAAEQAGHREVKDLESKLETRTRSMSKQVEFLSKNVRNLERENAAQKAQLDALRDGV